MELEQNKLFEVLLLRCKFKVQNIILKQKKVYKIAEIQSKIQMEIGKKIEENYKKYGKIAGKIAEKIRKIEGKIHEII